MFFKSKSDQNLKAENTQTNYARGVQAEAKACEYLIEQGYQILKQRYKTKFGEVDIVALYENVLCFVEVKMRQDIQAALESVSARSCRRIENSALYFVSQHPQYERYDIRFDVIAITKPFQITHLDNAWQAGA